MGVRCGGYAAEAAYRTLTFPDGNKANNKVSAYNTTWTAKIGDDSWSIKNFNNNSWNSWTYIRCGKFASTASIANTTVFAKPLTKIVLSIKKGTVSNLSSLKLIYSANKDYSNENTVNVSSVKIVKFN